jgi:microcin C transport system permease protein
MAQIQGTAGGGGVTESGGGGESRYRGSQGLDPAFRKEIEKQFGFDKPPAERFLKMLKDYARFDFGKSFFSKIPVSTLILQKLPVSISLGLWMTLLSYLISIPLGIRKAVRDGTSFDVATSFFVSVGFAIPSFLWAVLLATLFCGAYNPIFPLRGLTSDNFDQLSLLGKVGDYFWHIAMPVTALTLGSFATVTALTKNSFLDEINKAYVQTARMKGLTENRVLYGHLFRNSMMIVIAGFPGAFVGAFFTGSLVIEIIFSLDGLGRLSYESVIDRDYPIVFANIYIYALFGLVVNLISDLTYTWVDPRIDFEGREV